MLASIILSGEGLYCNEVRCRCIEAVRDFWEKARQEGKTQNIDREDGLIIDELFFLVIF